MIAGQGTAALELLEEAGPLDVLLVPVGGGGLLSGSRDSRREALAPECRVFGVEPEAGDDARRSLRGRRARARSTSRGRSPTARSADRRASSPSRSCAGSVDEIVTVTDAEIVARDAVRLRAA